MGDEILKAINREYVQMEQSNLRNNNETIKRVLYKVTNHLKALSPLFNGYYKSTDYVGSFYQNVKVKYADDYDIDLCLEIPRTTIYYLPPGFATVQVDNTYINSCKELKAMCDGNGCILRPKFLSWFQSLMARYTPEDNFTLHENGPSFTLKFNNFKMNIAIVLRTDVWPSYFEEYRSNSTGIKAFQIVPKGLSDAPSTWRLDFKKQEDEILHDKQQMKSAVKLLKLLRTERANIANLKSYWITTIALTLLDNNPHLFNSLSLHESLLKVLKGLQDCLMQQKMTYYWCEQYNLMENINHAYFVNSRNFLNRVINVLESRNEAEIRNLFDKKYVRRAGSRHQDFLPEPQARRVNPNQNTARYVDECDTYPCQSSQQQQRTVGNFLTENAGTIAGVAAVGGVLALGLTALFNNKKKQNN